PKPASDPPILPCRPSPCPAGRDGSPLSGVRPRPVRHPRPFRTSHQEPTMTRGKRIYVLDTNVLMHDPTALFKFEEHDIYLPMQVIEELDNAKKGTSEASRNARQVSRFLNDLVESAGMQRLDGGVPLSQPNGLQLRGRHAAGLLRFQTSHFEAGKS